MRQALDMAALATARSDTDLARFHRAGKPPELALVALARKLLTALNAILRQQTLHDHHMIIQLPAGLRRGGALAHSALASAAAAARSVNAGFASARAISTFAASLRPASARSCA